MSSSQETEDVGQYVLSAFPPQVIVVSARYGDEHFRLSSGHVKRMPHIERHEPVASSVNDNHWSGYVANFVEVIESITHEVPRR